MDKETLRDILNPSKTALVVWDVQNMLVEGIFDKEEFLENTNALIGAARGKNIPIFFTKITPLPERFTSPARKLYSQRSDALKRSPEGFELTIKPDEGDTVINKNTASVFIGTNFELMVRNAGVITLVFAGIATEIGIESSARDAFNRGFHSVVAKDAVSSRNKEAHERSLQNMEGMFTLATVAEISEAWREQ